VKSVKKTKKGYLCEDGKHLNIIGENLNGLYDEPYLSSVEWIGFIDVSADKIVLDYSLFQNLKRLMIRSYESYIFPSEICYLPHLEEISCNAKCLIPPEIGEMRNLQRLNLHGDCVVNMPKNISNVTSLKILTVNYYAELSQCQAGL